MEKVLFCFVFLFVSICICQSSAVTPTIISAGDNSEFIFSNEFYNIENSLEKNAWPTLDPDIADDVKLNAVNASSFFEQKITFVELFLKSDL